MKEIIIAGFGGDGVLFLGETISYSAFKENKHSTFVPSYGPESRGGTCNCHVKYSSEKIGSPVSDDPNTVIAMNQDSIDKFLPSLKKRGILIYDPSRLKEKPQAENIELIEVPAIDSSEARNMFMLGAYLQISKDINLETIVEQTLPEKMLKGKPKELLELNISEIQKGMNYITENYPQYK